MKTLIAELERATEGSRAMSKAVAIAAGWIHQPEVNHNFKWRCPRGHDRPHSAVPDYTESLDAALTLVPEGAYWAVRVSMSKFAGVVTPLGCVVKDCVANTPALALCIASLKGQAMKDAARCT